MGGIGSHKDAVPTRPPSRHGPGGTSGPPGRAGLRRPHSGPGHGRRLPEPRKANHPCGPGFMPADPGWQVLHHVQPGSYFRPTAHSLNHSTSYPSVQQAHGFAGLNPLE
jgi:hypothetical protein